MPAVEAAAPGQELLGVGADLKPGTMLAGYRSGLFPMGVDGMLGWWSPDPRGVLAPESFHQSRSLRRRRKAFAVTWDRAFDEVVDGCADPNRPHGWIDDGFRRAYRELFALGWAHSVEVWIQGDSIEPTLAGGLFGVEVGGLFAAESMFHRVTDASKVAVAALCARLARDAGNRLVDVQWLTPHLESLGAREVSRRAYLDLLGTALACPPVLGGDREPG